jgi:hypothetical protein
LLPVAAVVARAVKVAVVAVEAAAAATELQQDLQYHLVHQLL